MSNTTKFYSTTGDDGTTGLLGEGRVRKYHPRPEAYGTADEAQAAMGVARAAMQDQEAAEIVLQIQRDLYHLMAEMSATKDVAAQFRKIDAERVSWIEAQTDAYGKRLNLPKEFTVSGDTASGAALDLARTIVRRAERQVVRLFDEGLIENRDLIRYINRVSALLFVLSRHEDAIATRGDLRLAKVKVEKKKSRRTSKKQGDV
ncbi:MAG: cob(I)yrinic acid a,c-diamide adenosyltransferase [Anaerolineae bacterium]|nr:cob(I)yrinic acid a,c-diamide adenosyltransferase [Anaerolineae bacterium]